MHRKTPRPAAPDRSRHTPADEPAPDAAADPATEAAAKMEALAKAQQGLPSAEAFWKAAGRFCRLR